MVQKMKMYLKKKAETEAMCRICELIDRWIEETEEEIRQATQWIEENGLWQKDEGYEKPWNWDFKVSEVDELKAKKEYYEKLVKELTK